MMKSFFVEISWIFTRLHDFYCPFRMSSIRSDASDIEMRNFLMTTLAKIVLTLAVASTLEFFHQLKHSFCDWTYFNLFAYVS